jgi:hypothetical protein
VCHLHAATQLKSPPKLRTFQTKSREFAARELTALNSDREFGASADAVFDRILSWAKRCGCDSPCDKGVAKIAILPESEDNVAAVP